jgi:predicted glycosyltransferase involved in capsule biosynthesis
MQQTKYKISGQTRTKLKKELSELRILIKHFWYNHNLQKKAILKNEIPLSEYEALKQYTEYKNRFYEVQLLLSEKLNKQ